VLPRVKQALCWGRNVTVIGFVIRRGNQRRRRVIAIRFLTQRSQRGAETAEKMLRDYQKGVGAACPAASVLM
jgi:hypothetical protein